MLIDSTLREGAQMYGVQYSEAVKRRIVRGLIRLGVKEIELGWSGQSGLAELYNWAHDLDGSARFTVWSPSRESDLCALARQGVRNIHLGMPVSDTHMTKRLGLDRQEAETRLRLILTAARDMGFRFVSLGLEDISRAEQRFSLHMALVAQNCGADRIRLSDTVGLFTPLQTAETVQRFTRHLSVPVAFHAHDDFGMAAANAITALESGASWVDVSVLGIGERAGIAALEEVCAHLALVRKEPRFDLAAIRDLACTVSKAANIPISRVKAVVGEDIFACESGLHLHGLNRDPNLFEPYAPEHVRAKRKLGLGAKSGQAAVRGMLLRAGSDLRGMDMERMVRGIKETSLLWKRPLDEKEALALVAPSPCIGCL